MSTFSGIYRIAAVALAASALSGCASIESLFQSRPPAQHAHAKHAKPTTSAKATKAPHYDAAGFVQQLALAQLGLPEEADDTSVIAANLDSLQTYSADQPATPQHQQVIILTLKAQNGSITRQVIAPVDITPQTIVFPALLEIMNRLATMPCRLQDIRLATVTVAPPEALILEGVTAADVHQQLVQQQKLLLDSAEKPAALDEAKNELPLIRFFISHHFRDAAYLSVDNVKHLLAQAPQAQPRDAATVKTLSQQLDTLEGQLRKNMPYTLAD